MNQTSLQTLFNPSPHGRSRWNEIPQWFWCRKWCSFSCYTGQKKGERLAVPTWSASLNRSDSDFFRLLCPPGMSGLQHKLLFWWIVNSKIFTKAQKSRHIFAYLHIKVNLTCLYATNCLFTIKHFKTAAAWRNKGKINTTLFEPRSQRYANINLNIIM